jgi:hypothetical protein
MGKIRRFALLAGILAFVMAVLIIATSVSPPPTSPHTLDESPPADPLPDDVNVPEFVTPESPAGALSLVSASAMSLALFYAMKRK